MAYNELRKGRVSQSGVMYHITTVAQSRTPHFVSLDNGRKVVRDGRHVARQVIVPAFQAAARLLRSGQAGLPFNPA